MSVVKKVALLLLGFLFFSCATQNKMEEDGDILSDSDFEQLDDAENSDDDIQAVEQDQECDADSVDEVNDEDATENPFKGVWRQYLPTTVRAIDYDDGDYIWAAVSNEGIKKIDLNGNIVRVYNEKDGLNSLYLTAQYYDKRTDTVWVATDKGVTSIHNDTVRNYVIDSFTEDDVILALVVDFDGKVWVPSYYADKIYIIDEGTVTTIEHIDGIEASWLHIGVDEFGNIWLPSLQDMAMFDGEQWYAFLYQDTYPIAGALHIKSDTFGNVWTVSWVFDEEVTFFQLAQYDGVKWSLVAEDSEDYRWEDIHIDKDGKRWLYGYENLYLLEDDGNYEFAYTFVFHDERDEHYSHLIVDTNGVFWTLVSGDQEIYRSIEKNETEKTITLEPIKIANGYKGSTVFNLFIDLTDTIWIGVMGGGRFKTADRKNWEKTTLFEDRLTEDNTGILWKASMVEHALYKPENGKEIKIDFPDFVDDFMMPEILSFAVDKSGNAWVGFRGNGVIKYDGAEWTHLTMENGLSGETAYEIAVDADGSVWLAMGYALSKFTSDGKWITFDGINSPITGAVRSVTIDNNNVKWVGAGAGIHSFDDKEWHSYTKDNGELISGYIYQASVDSDNNIWVGEMGGISVFDGKNWYNFTADGLNPQKIAVDQHDNIFLGGDFGLIEFHRAQ